MALDLLLSAWWWLSFWVACGFRCWFYWCNCWCWGCISSWPNCKFINSNDAIYILQLSTSWLLVIVMNFLISRECISFPTMFFSSLIYYFLPFLQIIWLFFYMVWLRLRCVYFIQVFFYRLGSHLWFLSWRIIHNSVQLPLQFEDLVLRFVCFLLTLLEPIWCSQSTSVIIFCYFNFL